MKMICCQTFFLLQYEIKQSKVWPVHTCIENKWKYAALCLLE